MGRSKIHPARRNGSSRERRTQQLPPPATTKGMSPEKVARDLGNNPELKTTESMRRPEGQTRTRTRTRTRERAGQKLTSIVRLERKVDVEAPDSGLFIDFSIRYARANPYLETHNPGAMALTLVPSRALNAALDKRYGRRGYGYDQKVTANINRGISENFEKFTQNALTAYKETEELALRAEDINRQSKDSPLIKPSLPMESLWASGEADAKPDLIILSSRAVAVDLSGRSNDFLRVERHTLISDFLEGEEGLDMYSQPNLPKPDEWIPHLTIGRSITSSGLRKFPLIPVDMPDYVRLEAPRMLHGISET